MAAAAAATAAAATEIAAGNARGAHVELAGPFNRHHAPRDQTTGVLTTMARENYAEIENAALLDKEKLWPFIALEAKEKALRMWAKTTGYGEQMSGAAIGNRPKSVVR